LRKSHNISHSTQLNCANHAIKNHKPHAKTGHHPAASCQQKSHQWELSGNFPAFLGQKTAIFSQYQFDFKQIPTIPTKLTQYLTFKNNELNNIFTIQWE
jgi:hypothetical protein